MQHKQLLRLLCVLIFSLFLALPLSTVAADKKKPSAESAVPVKPSYELPQPSSETIDYTMYQRIRDEGLRHSHVMEYASALMDDIGPRLTGSPNVKRANEWTRDQLTAMGCSNAHLEDWGEFGIGWQQLNTWVRMASPDTAVFIAQAAPWSPSTNGPVNGGAVWVDIKKAEDIEKYKGKLGGKVVLLGDMREVKPVDKPLFERMDEKDLAKEAQYPLTPESRYSEYMKTFAQRRELNAKIIELFIAEHVLAVIMPSRDGENGGGSGGTIFDDRGLGMSNYQRDHALQFPVVVAAIENYGRVYRLLKANVPVNIRYDCRNSRNRSQTEG
jgi:carboxypeptidase Q